MIDLCLLCASLHRPKPPLKRLCDSCARLITALGPATQTDIDAAKGGTYLLTALFRYDEPLRQLILRAKVQGDHRALAFLRDLGAGSPEGLDQANWSDLLIVAPSSLWGRLRGRFDLADALARGLGQASGRPVLPAPWALRWRLGKRAKKRHRGWSPAQVLLTKARRRKPSKHPVYDGEGLQILVVDDIVTTGFTMANVAAEFPAAEVRCLALADAYS